MNIIYFDYVSMCVLLLTTVIGFTGFVYSYHQFRFLPQRVAFLCWYTLTCVSVAATYLVDNIILFALLNCLTFWLLFRLSHCAPCSNTDRAAKFHLSKHLLYCGALLFFGMLSLSLETTSFTFTQLLSTNDTSHLSLFLLIPYVFLISAALPFQRWLFNTFHAPTAVSALMHAGIISGGGLLLIRLAPVVLASDWATTTLFLAAILSIIGGHCIKLFQGGIKPILAASTVSQMGFMLLQCSMGLFGLALAHIVLHGLYKAYSFFQSNTIIRHQAPQITLSSNWLILTLLFLSGTWAFAIISGHIIDNNVMLLIACLSGMSAIPAYQVARQGINNIILSFIVALTIPGLQGLLAKYIALLLPLDTAIMLSTLHLFGLVTMMLFWMLVNTALFERLIARYPFLGFAALSATSPLYKQIAPFSPEVKYEADSKRTFVTT